VDTTRRSLSEEDEIYGRLVFYNPRPIMALNIGTGNVARTRQLPTWVTAAGEKFTFNYMSLRVLMALRAAAFALTLLLRPLARET